MSERTTRSPRNSVLQGEHGILQTVVDRNSTESLHEVSFQTNWRARGVSYFTSFPWALVVLVLAALVVLVRLPSPFWLDETMSYWTSYRGFHQILARCSLWPHPVLYSTLFWALTSMGAASEWVYRLPSFLAVAGATFLLFRMCRRLFGSDIAWMSAAAFVSIDPIRFAACDARPYGIALLLLVVSTDLFLKFLDLPGHRLAMLYGLSAAAVLHFQVLFGTVLLAHAIYLFYRWRRGLRIRLAYIVSAGAVLIAVAAPVGVQYLRFAANPASHSFVNSPAWLDLPSSYMPAIWLGAIEAAGLLALLRPDLTWQRAGVSRAFPLMVLWAAIPPAFMFTISRLTSAKLFVPRYFLSYSPGLAICCGIVFASFRPKAVRAAILSVMALFIVMSFGRPASLRHSVGLGDWGGAAQFVSRNVAIDNAPVLIRSQLTESDFMPIDPVGDNGNFAQLAFYPMRARLFPLRNTFTSEQMSFVHAFLQSSEMRKTGRFLFVSFTGPSPVEPVFFYLIGELGPHCKVTRLADFDGVAVTEFILPRV